MLLGCATAEAQAGDNMFLAKKKRPSQSMPGFLRLNDDAVRPLRDPGTGFPSVTHNVPVTSHSIAMFLYASINFNLSKGNMMKHGSTCYVYFAVVAPI